MSQQAVKFAYWVPNVSGGLVVSKIEQRTHWGIDYNRVKLHSAHGGLTSEAVRLNPAATQIGYQPNPPAPTQVWSKASGTPIGNY